jgi:catechol 2,3-dioxygenase-like lactoylglutathione lyase family enzyme
MIGRWQGLTIDCASPRDLATFYEALLGYHRLVDDVDWVVIGADERWPAVAFQRIPNYVPPTWPSSDRPSHMHVDVRVDDLSRAEAAALELGATLLQGCERFHVYADPAGHPFCLAEW